MRITDHRGLGDLVVQDQAGFDFGGTQAVTGNVKHVIDAAGDPVIAVFVAFRAVTGEVIALVHREIGFVETIMITVDGAHHRRPRTFHRQVTLGRVTLDLVTLVIEQYRLYPKERVGRGTGLERGRAWQRSQQVSTGLGLPPGIDDRAA